MNLQGTIRRLDKRLRQEMAVHNFTQTRSHAKQYSTCGDEPTSLVAEFSTIWWRVNHIVCYWPAQPEPMKRMTSQRTLLVISKDQASLAMR